MVNQKRIRKLNNNSNESGPVVYWMSREQRVQDNWALLYAQELAIQLNQPLIVVFNLVGKFLEATDRHFGFMLEGLKQVEKDLAKLNIPFVLLEGRPQAEVVKFVNENKVGSIITDFSPLKIGREWRESVASKISCPMFEVDAHNIIPTWVTSVKQEFGAYTIRPKIHKLLPEFLENFPKIKKHTGPTLKIRAENLWPTVTPHLTIKSGERAAHNELMNFIKNKLSNYNLDRNDPTKDAQSNLSAYLHFGQISAERVAIEILKASGKPLDEVMLPDRNGSKRESNEAAFLEELIIRRELSDNFCFYNQNYDNVNGFPVWAKQSILEHANDEREYIYSKKQFEEAKTHDSLWNAAQMQMVKIGKMHGYMRMYWAKKILEWTLSAKVAMKIAIYLNDKYQLDGRDPNGYAGISWSIGGTHDRAWFERPVFGKIRYMNYNGCKSKFDVEKYIKKWK
jgi:deoxyribodipyrimidine photo-lyase